MKSILRAAAGIFGWLRRSDVPDQKIPVGYWHSRDPGYDGRED
ncbi:hypothetical protein FB566_1246 [Stackebrandtia endophytica]|uniref:Uncharacterized protein n=1 Tax=Stackebrandtia endophytica TaxID=1496996 RepID=A0A543AT24_9ACTN|nr:hypothetical protein FB566_1246 [Stackebrandtia endophytica]